MSVTMDPTILEWMYAREMCRRLGFTPDEIYFEVFPSGLSKNPYTGVMTQLGGPIIALSIRRGDQVFQWIIGATQLPAGQIQAAYETACDAWNADNFAFDLEAFRASKSMSHAVELLLALKTKGFTLENG